MSVPIVFFFKNYDPYIAFSLWQARQTNPNLPVYMLGDESNDLSFLDVRHVLIGDYPGKRDELVACYQHFSKHELECERLCIERWFHLAAFVEQHKIDEFIYLDSDLMLTMDIGPLIPSWRAYDIAGIPGFYGACYFSHRRVLLDFCDYVLDLYRNAQQVEHWRAAYEYSIRHPGAPAANVSDMLLAQMFLKTHQAHCLDLRKVIDGIVFNENFLVEEKRTMEVCRGANGRGVYAQVEGRLVQLACLHFIGWSKRFLSSLTGWSPPLVRCFFKPKYRRNVKKLVQHYYFGKRFRKHIRPRQA